MEKKDIEVFLAIVFYLLAIAEEVLQLRIFSWLYSTINQTTVFALLLIVATGFIITYLLQSTRKPKYLVIFNRTRPNTDLQQMYTGYDYDVRWHLYEPSLLDKRPWADGPYCPECARELDVVAKGHISKQEVWKCPMCGKEYPKPKGDVKDIVEKNFAAYLRKKGKL